MNERIKKLKEQATSYTWNGNDVTEELDEEKFAELIVRECIKVVDDTMTENQEMNIGLVMASAAIVAHFEVEE
jgi:hypothetical protein